MARWFYDFCWTLNKYCKKIIRPADSELQYKANDYLAAVQH